jgi:multiple sugar transport system ATP-binding protein
MRAELRDLHARLGSTMIYVTHDQVEAMTLADKIVVLRAGKIEQIGTPKELYERPINTFVAGFIGSPRMNFIANGIGRIGIRPEHIRINTDGEGRALTVQQFEYMGASSLLQGVLADGAKIEVLLTQPLNVSRGDSVMLSWDVAHEHHFDKNEQRISY